MDILYIMSLFHTSPYEENTVLQRDAIPFIRMQMCQTSFKLHY